MPEKLLTCPDCDYSPLDITVEDGSIIFSCENCGWQRIENNYFDLTVWRVEIHQALAPIDILQSLLTSEHIVEFLGPRLKGVSYLRNLNFSSGSDEYLLGEVARAHQIYLSQMIVLAVTYTEVILKDFFHCLFIAQPIRMNEYLSPEGQRKASVSPKEILNTSSKEDLITNLAEPVVEIVVRFNFDEVVKKIIKNCQIKLDRPLVEDLGELIKLRNQIIHDANFEEEVSVQKVHNSFGLLLYLLYILGQASKKYGLPYLDADGFLDDFEKQLRKS